MKKTKVAFVASTLVVGGAENVLLGLLTHLPGDRFEARTFLLRAPGPIGEILLRKGIACEHGLQKHRADPTVLLRLAPRLKRFAPDILFSLDHHNAMFWGRLSSILAGVRRRVVVSHSTGRMDSRRSFTALDRLLMRFTDRVVALSAAHAAYLRDVEEVDPGKIVIIENGIDIARFENTGADVVDRLRRELGIAEDEHVVAMVAALRPEKAHEALLEAAKSLGRDRPDLRLVFLVIGDGPRRRMLETTSERLGIASSVRFLGSRQDVPDLLGLSNVLVLPSHPAVETLPLAVLEAMAAGTPVVASAVGSVPDIIEDGWNGRLIAPADAVGLSEAICHIFDKSQETKQIIEHAKETIRNRYTVEEMASKYQRLFEQIAA